MIIVGVRRNMPANNPRINICMESLWKLNMETAAHFVTRFSHKNRAYIEGQFFGASNYNTLDSWKVLSSALRLFQYVQSVERSK